MLVTSPATEDNAPRLGGGYAWFIWSLAAISFGYAFFHRVTPSVMVSDLMTEFAIGGAMLGSLSALYFYSYIFFWKIFKLWFFFIAIWTDIIMTVLYNFLIFRLYFYLENF